MNEVKPFKGISFTLTLSSFAKADSVLIFITVLYRWEKVKFSHFNQ